MTSRRKIEKFCKENNLAITQLFYEHPVFYEMGDADGGWSLQISTGEWYGSLDPEDLIEYIKNHWI